MAVNKLQGISVNSATTYVHRLNNTGLSLFNAQGSTNLDFVVNNVNLTMVYIDSANDVFQVKTTSAGTAYDCFVDGSVQIEGQTILDRYERFYSLETASTADLTPSVNNRAYCLLPDASATYTDFDDGAHGQILCVVGQNTGGSTACVSTSGNGVILPKGTWTANEGATLTLVYISSFTAWVELSRTE